jgi:hypothetical protein
MTLLAHYRPEALLETPPVVINSLSGFRTTEHRKCCRLPDGPFVCTWTLGEIARAEIPSQNAEPGAHYGDNRRILPQIRDVLGDANEE